MIKTPIYFLALVLTLAPLAARADSQCSAVCEFYTSHVKYKGDGFVEKMAVQFEFRGKTVTELAKYRLEVASSGKSIGGAFQNLLFACFDKAMERSEHLYLDTDYAPMLKVSQAPETLDTDTDADADPFTDSVTAPALVTAKDVCT